MKTFITIAALAICTSAFAFGSLVSERISGSLKYCTYSNGVVITVQSYELCPVTIN